MLQCCKAAVVDMKLMIPFYYILAALLFGLIGGFCAECYRYSDGEFLHFQTRIFFTTLKTKSSSRYIIVDDFLLGELKRWHNRQIENEKSCGDSYVYRESDGHIKRRSKSLYAPDGEKISLVCTRDDGRLILRNVIVVVLKNE